MKLILISLTLLISIIHLAMAADSGKKPVSVDDCVSAAKAQEKQCKTDECQSTNAQVSRLFDEVKCLKTVMNSELDKRLLALKKSDQKQFKSEMKLQKDFNAGLDAACEAFNSCVGEDYTGVYRALCYVEGTKWRAEQAHDINSNQLHLSTKKPKPTVLKGVSTIANVQTFVDELCAMPKDVFSDKHSPEKCKDLVLQNFAIIVGGKDLNDDVDPFTCTHPNESN
jgi:hypothetical protein